MTSLTPALAPTHLSPIDLAIVAFYLVAITLFGLRFSKRSKRTATPGGTLRTYFLADNTIPWWAIALSIVSAETSTLTIISVPGVAFTGNFGFLQIVLGYMLGRIVVAVLFLPRYFRGEMLTAYQLIHQRFGPTLHKTTAGLFLLTRAAAEGVRVFAISIVVGIAIGTGDTLSIAIISALTLLYTFEGGMAAVIWTDVVQMGLYIIGTLAAIWTLGQHVPGGWSQIHAIAAPLGKFQILDFTLNLTQTYTFWAGVLGGTFLTMASHGTDQLMVQRMLAARNLRESRLALLSSGVVIFLQFTLFLLIGAGLFIFYGGHPTTFTSPDRIFPTFIVQEMPHGVAGLLVAAILAAAMSNLSAALNSLASTTVVDFYLPWKTWLKGEPSSAARPLLATPATTQQENRERTFISRAATVFWALVLFAIAVYAIQHGGKGHVVETGLSIASVAYGSLLGVFLLGTLTRYATQTGTIIGMVTGFTLNLALWLQPHAISFNSGWTYTTPTATHYVPFTLPKVAFTWYVLIGALVTFAIGSLASLLFRKESTHRAIATGTILGLLATGTHILHAQAPAPQEPVILSAATNPRNSLLPLPFPALASRYPKPSPLGLSAATRESGLQPLRDALAQLAAKPPASTPDFTPISTLITQAIAGKKLPGAVVLIGHNGKIAFEQAYGLRKLPDEPGLDGKPSPAEPMTEDTIFDMASLSKVLATTTAIMQLYEAHKLEIDVPVARYLPAFAANGKENVTIRELLTHYSGLPPDVSLKDPWGLAAPDRAEGLRRALASPLVTAPGTHFEYSDINFITLGLLVETLSNQPSDVYSSEHIFHPLGMVSTAFHPFAKTCGPHIEHGAAIEPGPKPFGHIGMVCLPGTWSPFSLDPITAPTAHDNELSAEVNPDFDHLLRGTVHDPTTRRMGGVAGHAGVFSTAHDSALFAQALLDKLTKNTGPFPLKQSTLELMTTPQQPPTAGATATIFTPDGQSTKGVAARGLGWDINSPFSRPRGEIFPISTTAHPGSFGHTGFTGTSLWIDPTSNTYIILLANAIHPRGAAPISALRSQIATAAALALGLTADSGGPSLSALTKGGVTGEAQQVSSLPAQTESSSRSKRSAAEGPAVPSLPASSKKSSAPTLTGIDVLESTHFAVLQQAAARHNGHLRLGLLTNQSGLDAQGHRTIDILGTETHKAVPEVTLSTIFSPEHGLYGAHDDFNITNDTDPATHLPIISVYGPKPADKHPKRSDLANLDAVVIDLQDAGVHFWTYEALTGYFLEAAAMEKSTGHNLEIIVLDRPSLTPATAPRGPVSDTGAESYTNYMPLPVQHAMTFGELAQYFNGELHLNADLTVIPMQNWSRSEFFDDTHLPWIPPSPNLRTATAATLYPGIGLVEQTNISVGRGTASPFENIAAPWIKPAELVTYLTARKISGVSFTPTALTIAEDSNHYPFHGQTIPGIHFTITDARVLDSPELGIELLSALHHLYPEFQLARAKTLLANAATLDALIQDQDPRAIAATWQPALAAFRARRQPYLLYH